MPRVMPGHGWRITRKPPCPFGTGSPASFTTTGAFGRFGGACPLWIVHEAVAIPDRIHVQLAEMPDGIRYVSIAKGLVNPSGSYYRQPRRYAVVVRYRSTGDFYGRVMAAKHLFYDGKQNQTYEDYINLVNDKISEISGDFQNRAQKMNLRYMVAKGSTAGRMAMTGARGELSA